MISAMSPELIRHHVPLSRDSEWFRGNSPDGSSFLAIIKLLPFFTHSIKEAGWQLLLQELSNNVMRSSLLFYLQVYQI
jgi:hypothetical protein